MMQLACLPARGHVMVLRAGSPSANLAQAPSAGSGQALSSPRKWI